MRRRAVAGRVIAVGAMAAAAGLVINTTTTVAQSPTSSSAYGVGAEGPYRSTR